MDSSIESIRSIIADLEYGDITRNQVIIELDNIILELEEFNKNDEE